MRIIPLNCNYQQPVLNIPAKTVSPKKNEKPLISYIDCVNFTANNSRKIEDIDYHRYKFISPQMKQFLRIKCKNFAKNVEAENLANKNLKELPLMNDQIMKDYIEICDYYNSYKDETIICLGRSPKWFLDTAKCMKNGIDNYKFVAFSEYWHSLDKYGNPIKLEYKAPTPKEKRIYKKYLQTNTCSPKDIVDIYKKQVKKLL